MRSNRLNVVLSIFIFRAKRQKTVDIYLKMIPSPGKCTAKNWRDYGVQLQENLGKTAKYFDETTKQESMLVLRYQSESFY